MPARAAQCSAARKLSRCEASQRGCVLRGRKGRQTADRRRVASYRVASAVMRASVFDVRLFQIFFR